jgi:hypothetical protein
MKGSENKFASRKRKSRHVHALAAWIEITNERESQLL